MRSVDRADHDTIATLRDSGVATAHEAAGRVGLLGPAVQARQAGTAIAGSAITVSCPPGDNLMIHAAIEVCRPGDVLVVTTTSPSTDGMFGELLAVSARAQGVSGLVIDAGVRDVTDLTRMDFPVWAKAISAQGTVKATAGSDGLYAFPGLQPDGYDLTVTAKGFREYVQRGISVNLDQQVRVDVAAPACLHLGHGVGRGRHTRCAAGGDDARQGVLDRLGDGRCLGIAGKPHGLGKVRRAYEEHVDARPIRSKAPEAPKA